MSPLLKSGGGGNVRRFTGGALPEVASVVAQAQAIDPRDAELARLKAEIERMTAARAQDAAEAAKAIEAAREQGHGEGLVEAQTGEADRLAALGTMLKESVAVFTARLEVLDALAPALARTALAKLFEGADGWAAPVEAMLARQLGALRRGTLIAVRVSPQDFPDAQALAALSDALDIEGLGLASDRALRAGGCRIECRLGQIDLDVREQWQALSALLEEMAG